MVYKKITIDITPTQLRKAADGKQITLSGQQLQGGSTSIHVHPANYEKIMKARKAGRGTRIFIAPGSIEYDLMQGGSVWSWLKDKAYPWLKNNWSTLKPVASALADAGATFIPGLAGPRAQLKSLTGVGVKKMGKGTPEMKAHMADLRSRRKGGSFKLS